MIRIKLYQNNNHYNETAYGKWYPRVVCQETLDLDDLAAHMATHNTPFSKGTIKGILTDAVACTRELLLQGNNVKFPDLAIFSIGLRMTKGAESKDQFAVDRNISGLKLRARATGNLSTPRLDAVIRRVDQDSATKPGTLPASNAD